MRKVIARIVSQLLNVPSTDPEDARRRRLLNILLICIALMTLVGFLTAVIDLTPPWWKGTLFYWIVAGILSGAAVIYVINRYWSGQVAIGLFLLLLIASALAGDLEEITSGRGLLMLAIPVVVASFLLRPYASFIVAGLVSVAIAIVRLGILLADPNLPAILTFFLIALVSQMAAYNLERALGDLHVINRELDQRVAERTRDLERRSIQLQTASEVARDATATLHIEKLLDDTVHLISARFGFYHAGVFLIDEHREYAVLRAASSESGQRMLAEGHKLAVGQEGVVGHVAATGESFVVLDVSQEMAHYVNPDLPDTRSEMALPLISRGRVIGVLDVQSAHKSIFTQEDVATLQTMADQLANAMESARLYDEARRHLEELTALHNIDMAMISTLDLDEVLTIIYEQISEILEVASFYIALYDEGRDELRVPLIVDRGEHLPPFTSRIEENGGLAGWVIRHRQPLWIDDLEEERERWPAETILVGGSMRSLMVLPLIVRGRIMGIISAQAPEPHAFSGEDQRLFSNIAHQAAIAITNAWLYEEVRKRLDEAHLIQEVMLAAASTLDFDLVLERVVKALHRALGIDRLGFLLPDEQNDVLVLHPSLVGFAKDIPHTPIRGTMAGQVYRAGHPILVRDRARESVSYLEQSSDVRSALAVPVRVGGRIVAVFYAESTREGVFGEDELRVLTTIAGQLGVTLESARLYQEMAQYTRDLRLLADASGGMIGSLEPRQIVEHLLTALVERFHAVCSISLTEPDGESLQLVAGWMPGGEPLSIPVGHRVHLSEHGVFKRVAEARRFIYVPDVAQSEWWMLISEQEREAAQQQGVRAALILPMLSQERLVGVVFLSFTDPLPEPVDEQLDWVQTLVNQAAAASANAQLYQELEAQAAELSRAYNELQEIDRLRTQLIQNVSHELRTPLGLIKGYVELLAAGDLGELVESQRSALRIIRERTATLTRLIHNLTILQAVPREALALAPVSIVDVVQEAIEEFQRSATEAGVVFHLDLPADLPPTLGDRERLALVFGHLVDNAVKFSPGGGTVALRAWADDGAVYISVVDEGIGIPPESVGRIFDRFYQVDGSAKRRFGGMGIGLALVWEIVEAHDGAVMVESEVGKGSAFTVQLPRLDITRYLGMS